MALEQALEMILTTCVTEKTQDLYFRPNEAGWQLLQRLPTKLVVLQQCDQATGRRYLNMLKYVAQMDISEVRRPQTGRWQLETDQALVYLRLATVADFLNREGLVIRFIYPLAETYHCRDEKQLRLLQQFASQPGLMLFAGPTGVGKTTSLYYLAQQTMAGKMVVTIEDPIEINQPAFLQLQVNQAAGLSYAALLKISLRLRPDTLIIGEIRDLETAQHAISAALSGHLVLSTIHARSALGVVERLCDLGIPESRLKACLTCVAAQKLVSGPHNQLAAQYDILDTNAYFGGERHAEATTAKR